MRLSCQDGDCGSRLPPQSHHCLSTPVRYVYGLWRGGGFARHWPGRARPGHPLSRHYLVHPRDRHDVPPRPVSGLVLIYQVDERRHSRWRRDSDRAIEVAGHPGDGRSVERAGGFGVDQTVRSGDEGSALVVEAKGASPRRAPQVTPSASTAKRKETALFVVSRARI